MAKSLRSKMQRRLRTLRRDLAQPFYDNKDAAKLAAQQAALAAPKVPVRGAASSATDGGDGDDVMAADAAAASAAALDGTMDVEMDDGGSSKWAPSLKPFGGVGKKSKKKQKGQRRGRGKYKRKHK